MYTGAYLSYFFWRFVWLLFLTLVIVLFVWILRGLKRKTTKISREVGLVKFILAKTKMTLIKGGLISGIFFLLSFKGFYNIKHDPMSCYENWLCGIGPTFIGLLGGLILVSVLVKIIVVIVKFYTTKNN